MKNIKKTLALILAMIFAICALVGCGNSQTETTTQAQAADETTGDAAAADKQTIKIAIATCFSGNAARGAETQLLGLEVALNEIEESGYSKYYDFTISQYDDKYDATEAVTVANKLVYQDDCDVVFGHLNAVVTIAGLSVYDEAGIPCFTPSGSAGAIVDGTHKNTYLCVPQDRIMAESLIKYIVEDLGIKELGLLYSNNDQGTSGKEYCEEALTALNLKFADEETYAVEDNDFSGQLLNMKSAGVKAVVIWGGEITQRPVMIKNIKQILGDDCLIATDGNSSNASFIEATTVEDRKGVVYPSAWSPSFTDERSQKYVEEFKALDSQSGTPGAVTVRFYDGLYLLATALNDLGPYDVDADDFSEKLNEAIKNASYTGLQGEMKPQANGECLASSYIVTYGEDGNETLIK